MNELINVLGFPRAWLDAVLLIAVVILAICQLHRLKSRYGLRHTRWITTGLLLYVPVWLIDNITRATKNYDFSTPPGSYVWLLWGVLRLACLTLVLVGLVAMLKEQEQKK